LPRTSAHLHNRGVDFVLSSVRRKLLAGYVLTFVALGIIGVLAFLGLQRSLQTNALVVASSASLSNATTLEKALVDMETGARGFVITGDDRFLEPYQQGRPEATAALGRALALETADPSVTALLTDLSLRIERWDATALQPEIAARRRDAATAAAMVQSGAGKNQLDAMRTIISQYVTDKQSEVKAALALSDDATRSLQTVIVFGGVAIALVGLVTAAALTTSIGRRVRMLQQRAERVASGDLDGDFSPPARGDEIDALARAFQDMTARLRELVATKEQLAASDRAAREEAQQASHAKTDFLASMSHELRTPLNAILGFSGLLEEQLGAVLSARQKKYLRNVGDAGAHLLELVNDVLDLSKVESGRAELRRETIDLETLVEPALASARQAAGLRDVGFEATIPDGVRVRVDIGQLRQILYNLLSNATKFTPPGGTVTLRAERRDEVLELMVSDTGIGIPPARRDRVFGMFERVNADRSEAPGTGLGLALTKRLVELHGGTIDFESAEGRGTTFRVVLPGAVVTSDARPRLLVVEDEERDADLITELASAVGLRSEVVQSAAEAELAIVRSLPIAIVLDLRLPEVRGERLLEKLKSAPETRGVPVMIVSVEDDDGSVRRLGAEAYLTKPIDRARLTAWLSRLDGIRESAAR
jgi:signal transduction histidine kinase/ActR/RegA family two-component response regulator